MKFQSTAAASLLFSVAIAAPVVERQAAITDADILQYALTLEHLENVFYKGAISSMPEQEFLDAGFTSEYYTNLKYIASDEEQHVLYLEAALKAAGATPVAACQYKFPYTDPKSFVTLASVLEGVGTSAYLGGAGLITSKTYLGVAGSILVTEALHTSLQRFNLGEVAPANPYGTALGLNPVYTLAAAFITSCPASNAALPVKAFPALTATQGEPTSQGISFTFSTKMTLTQKFYITFASGLNVTSVDATLNNGQISTTIPTTITGQSYAFVTSSSVTALNDSVILAGPAIVEVTPPSPQFDISQQ
ncbi:MAG: hypothetical protein M1812_006424 [Candelaria pacifica]|nr:MAG: hypothetical protein M1812_006424 [Candelaria pacifica]